MYTQWIPENNLKNHFTFRKFGVYINGGGLFPGTNNIRILLPKFYENHHLFSGVVQLPCTH